MKATATPEFKNRIYDEIMKAFDVETILLIEAIDTMSNGLVLQVSIADTAETPLVIVGKFALCKGDKAKIIGLANAFSLKLSAD